MAEDNNKTTANTKPTENNLRNRKNKLQNKSQQNRLKPANKTKNKGNEKQKTKAKQTKEALDLNEDKHEKLFESDEEENDLQAEVESASESDDREFYNPSDNEYDSDGPIFIPKPPKR